MTTWHAKSSSIIPCGPMAGSIKVPCDYFKKKVFSSVKLLFLRSKKLKLLQSVLLFVLAGVVVSNLFCFQWLSRLVLQRISDPELSPCFFVKLVVALVVLGGMLEVLIFVVLKGFAVNLFLLSGHRLFISNLSTWAPVWDGLVSKLFAFIYDQHLKTTDILVV